MQKPNAIRVVLADDHAVVRKGIREFLEEVDDIRVVAEAATGADALVATLEQGPDVVVLNIQMPQMSGVEAARQIKSQVPEVRVLVLTAYDDDPYIFAMLQVGASGYGLKNASSEELVRAVREVAAGESAPGQCLWQAGGQFPHRGRTAGYETGLDHPGRGGGVVDATE